MYCVPASAQCRYNPQWTTLIFAIRSRESVKEAYDKLIEDRKNPTLLFEAIMSANIETIEYFFSEGIIAEKKDIEASAIYSGSIEVVKYLFDKGYTFDSNDIMATAKFYSDNSIYHTGHHNGNTDVYNYITMRYKVQQLCKEENNYLEWLSNTHIESLKK